MLLSPRVVVAGVFLVMMIAAALSTTEEERPSTADRLKWWQEKEDDATTDDEEQGRMVVPEPPLAPCMDLNPSCSMWMEKGDCIDNVVYMTMNCPWSCNLCNPLLNRPHVAAAAPRDNNNQEEEYQEWVNAIHQTRHRPLLEWAGVPQRTNFTNSLLLLLDSAKHPTKTNKKKKDSSTTAEHNNNSKDKNTKTGATRRTITTTTNHALGENEKADPSEDDDDEEEASWIDHLANEGGTGMMPPPHKRTDSYIRGRIRHVTLAMEYYLQTLDSSNFAPKKASAPGMVLHRINDDSFSFVAAGDRGGVTFYPHFRQSFAAASSSDDDDPHHQQDLVPDVVAQSVECKNRHENCAYWAARGLCEWRFQYMKEVCAPMCHLCHGLELPSATTTTTTASGSGIVQAHSPFQRLDLVGMFEAMEEDRVVVATLALEAFSSSKDETEQPNNATSSSSSSSNTLSVLRLGQFKTYVYRLRAGSPSAQIASRARRQWEERKRRAAEKSMQRRKGQWSSPNDHDKKNSKKKKKKKQPQSRKTQAENDEDDKEEEEEEKQDQRQGDKPNDKDAADGPFIVQFDKFLTADECGVLLDLLREQTERKRRMENPNAADTNDDDDDDDDDKYRKDGFTTTSMDVTVEKEGPLLNIVRSSFREYYYPPQQPGQVHWWEYHKVWNRLLSKLEVVTGIPRQHVDLPLQFDKYAKDGFLDVASHFAHVAAPKPPPPPDSYQPHTKTPTAGKPQDAFAHLHQARFLQNAPLVGVILFLSTVEHGGELVFPNMGNFTVKPLAGRAILFPTTLSLVGNGGWFRTHREDDKLHWGFFANRQDAMRNDDEEEPPYKKQPPEGWEDVPVLDGTTVVGDGTFLVEDLGTLFRHAKQSTSPKPKYTLTLYLRRYPTTEEK